MRQSHDFRVWGCGGVWKGTTQPLSSIGFGGMSPPREKITLTLKSKHFYIFSHCSIIVCASHRLNYELLNLRGVTQILGLATCSHFGANPTTSLREKRSSNANISVHSGNKQLSNCNRRLYAAYYSTKSFQLCLNASKTIVWPLKFHKTTRKF